MSGPRSESSLGPVFRSGRLSKGLLVSAQREHQAGWALGVLVAAMTPILALVALLVGLITVIAPPSNASCGSPAPPVMAAGGSGEWLATSYGPPWEGIQGSGVTATGIDLRPAKHAYIIAVDPSVIPLGSYVHVSPNPFNDESITFQAADTGGAILGKHIDIYDWRGRSYQDAWGARKVTVTPAAKTGAGNVLGATPSATTEGAAEVSEPSQCDAPGTEGPLPLTPGQTAKVLPDGLAAAPKEAPRSVMEMIAAGNRLHDAAYVYGGGHGPSLNTLQAGYDCSSSVSYVLHAGGAFGETAEVSSELESYGSPGPGKWVTVYANSEHAFMYVAGIRFDTSHNGTDTGPNENQDGPRWRVFPEVPKWAQWVVRHPPGL
jgi:3D (Asp-Asp-Asp) domain-containing protein